MKKNLGRRSSKLSNDLARAISQCKSSLAKLYLQPGETSMIELFGKIADGW